jgi:transglutaminase-like putative cysteine protease
VLCAFGAAVTTVLYGSFYATDGYLPRLAAFAPLGAACGFASAALAGRSADRPRRLRALLAAGSAVAVFVIAAFYIILPGQLAGGLPDLTSLRTVWDSLTGGWAAMLSVGTPAADTAQMLMTPAAVTFAAAFAAGAASVRPRVVLAPAAPLMAAEVVGLLFASDKAGGHLVQAAVLLAVFVALAMLRADPAGRVPAPAHAPVLISTAPPPQPAQRPKAKYAALRIAMALLIVVASLGFVSVLPAAHGTDRYYPHTLFSSALNLDPVISPLSDVRMQLLVSPPQNLFTVTVRAPAAADVDRVRTATLDEFDGADWTSSDTFRVASSALAPGPALPGAATVTAQVEVTGALPGPFLPSVGRPERIDTDLDGAQVGFASSSGDLATGAADLRGGSYTVTGLVRPPDAALKHTLPGTGAAYSSYIALQVAAPTPLASLAARLAGPGSPYTQLESLASHLRQEPYSLGSVPGFSYATLENMLGGGHSAAGDAAQHAAAFAVLARIEGLPTRIAVGYLLHDGHDGVYAVDTADAFAWDEVYFQGYGWVTFDPTDPRQAAPSVPPTQHPSAPTTQVPSTPPTVAPSPVSASPAPAARTGPGQDLVSLLISGAKYTLLLALPTALALIAAANLGRKLSRRFLRRRRGQSREQVSGAWLEALDRLREYRLDVPPWLSARAVPDWIAPPGAGPGGAPQAAVMTLTELGRLAQEAVYGPGPIGPDQAAEAWKRESALHGQLYPGRLVVRRALHRVAFPPGTRRPGRPRHTGARTGDRL